jgi:BCD family chlorophyll transporter-like MFS transporter
VVALLYVMLLLGMVASGALFSALLDDFSQVRLIQVVQGAAAVAMALNCAALWKQEARDPSRTAAGRDRPAFAACWQAFNRQRRARRFLWMTGLGSAAFSMQDVLLEPYGGEILGLGVGATTRLTAFWACGALLAFAWAAARLGRGADPYRLAACGAVAGLAAFAAVIFAAPLQSGLLFQAGCGLIGFGGGLFSVGTLTAAMALDDAAEAGLAKGVALGAWGAVQATAAGAAVAAGGLLRDLVSAWGTQGLLGEALATPAAGYGAVYHLEILLLFATLVALGPLVRSPSEHAATGPGRNRAPSSRPPSKYGLAEFPG